MLLLMLVFFFPTEGVLFGFTEDTKHSFLHHKDFLQTLTWVSSQWRSQLLMFLSTNVVKLKLHSAIFDHERAERLKAILMLFLFFTPEKCIFLAHFSPSNPETFELVACGTVSQFYLNKNF